MLKPVKAIDRGLWVLPAIELKIPMDFAEPRDNLEVLREFVEEYGAVRIGRVINIEVQRRIKRGHKTIAFHEQRWILFKPVANSLEPSIGYINPFLSRPFFKRVFYYLDLFPKHYLLLFLFAIRNKALE